MLFAGPNTHRSPYVPSVGPAEVDLLHATRRTIVRCKDYGLVGAPYPKRYLTCPVHPGSNVLEKGWSDNGMFVPDAAATVPRRYQVRLDPATAPLRQQYAPGLEIGDPEADFPERAVLMFRYDVMEIGIDPSSRYHGAGGATGFDCRHEIELSEPFGGLTASDLFVGGVAFGSNEPLSHAAYRAADLAKTYLGLLHHHSVPAPVAAATVAAAATDDK